MKINPEYREAPYEMNYLIHGKLNPDLEPHPLRFRQSDVKKALALMESGQFDKLRELAVPEFIL